MSAGADPAGWWWGPRRAALWPLLPLAGLYCAAAWTRRQLYRWGLRRAWRAPVPVVVVGNLTVGGSGKTPLVVALARWLAARGRRPGIVSRGYRRASGGALLEVGPEDDAGTRGDEAVLMARRAACPVVVAADRPAGAARLVALGCDVVLSDDGLQHYRLARDLEIAVVDGRRGHGNRWCLPAGPLREPLGRLRTVDAVVFNGGDPRPGTYAMRLEAGPLTPLAGGEAVPAARWAGRRVHAVAGIGDPRRFFDLLAGLGLEVIPHPFPDHHPFRPRDLDFGDRLPVIMTEKDAVKCRFPVAGGAWYLPVTARVDPRLLNLLAARLGLDAPATDPEGH